MLLQRKQPKKLLKRKTLLSKSSLWITWERIPGSVSALFIVNMYAYVEKKIGFLQNRLKKVSFLYFFGSK